MGSTAVGNGSVNTTLFIDRLVNTLKEIHESLEDYVYSDKISSYSLDLIENMLDEYETLYGRGAKRVRHIKQPNGVFIVDGE